MPKVLVTSAEITFVEEIPKILRIILVILGLLPMLLAPYELLIRPRWSALTIYMIVPILISTGAVLLGCLFIAAGLFGWNQTLKFAARSGEINYAYYSAIVALRRKTYQFHDLVKSEVITHDWSDGPSTYGLRFTFRDGQRIEIANFEQQIEAEQHLSKVENLIR